MFLVPYSLLEQPDDLHFWFFSGTAVPDFARWLCHGVAIFVDPICGSIIGAKNVGEVGLDAKRHHAGGIPALQLLNLYIAFAFYLPIHRQAYFKRTIFLFVDSTMKYTEGWS